MLDFWETDNTSYKLRQAYPPAMAAALPSDDWMGEPGIAFPLYRLTGGNVNYRKLMTLGIAGLHREVMQRQHDVAAQGRETTLFDAWRIALDVLADVCRHYERQAHEKAQATGDARRKRELLDLADALAALTVGPPRHLREAIQLFWLYALVADVRNHGRMDVYLGDFLARDLKEGVLTEADALRLLQSLWRLMADRNTRGRISRASPRSTQRILGWRASRSWRITTWAKPKPNRSATKTRCSICRRRARR